MSEEKNIKTENYTKFVDAYVSRALVLARLKRFNEARFAAGANRDYMESIEFTKLRLEDLVTVALEEMGAIADVLGL